VNFVTLTLISFFILGCALKPPPGKYVADKSNAGRAYCSTQATDAKWQSHFLKVTSNFAIATGLIMTFVGSGISDDSVEADDRWYEEGWKKNRGGVVSLLGGAFIAVGYGFRSTSDRTADLAAASTMAMKYWSADSTQLSLCTDAYAGYITDGKNENYLEKTDAALAAGAASSRLAIEEQTKTIRAQIELRKAREVLESPNPEPSRPADPTK
jgi:hypothetical protein